MGHLVSDFIQNQYGSFDHKGKYSNAAKLLGWLADIVIMDKADPQSWVQYLALVGLQ